MEFSVTVWLTSFFALVAGATMASESLKNGSAEWLDTEGQPINCHCDGEGAVATREG